VGYQHPAGSSAPHRPLRNTLVRVNSIE